jgi:hypothetical protein
LVVFTVSSEVLLEGAHTGRKLGKEALVVV